MFAGHRHTVLLNTLSLLIAAGYALRAQEVDFRASPRSGTAPLTVSFHGDSDFGGPREWRWDFGDGSRSDERNPEHTYRAAGKYTVTLTVSPRFGREITEVKSDFISVVSPVELGFDAAPTSGCAPLSVRFTNRSSPDDDDGDGWEWDFGDGGTSTERDPTHTYSSGGVYTVRLRRGGAEEVRRDLIRVSTIEPIAAPRYVDTAGIGSTVEVSWGPSVTADAHSLERQIDGSAWTRACEVGSGGSDDLACDVLLDRAGTWRFRVVATSSCGEATSSPGPPLVVRPPPPRLFWSLDDCAVREAEAGLDGSVLGTIACGASNRFGTAERSLEFYRSGLVLIAGIPRRPAEWTISFWFRGDDTGESNSTILELASPNRDNVLRLRWERDDFTVRFEHGEAEIAVSGLAAGVWHHLALTRADSRVHLFVDGRLAGAEPHTFVPGEILALGARIDEGDYFSGGIDDVLYDNVGREVDAVRNLLLDGGPTVLAGARDAREISAEAGRPAEALRLNLQPGTARLGGVYRLEILRVSAWDEGTSGRYGSGYTGRSGSEQGSLARIESLHLRAAGRQGSLGELRREDGSSSSVALYSWTSERGGEPLPGGLATELIVEAFTAESSSPAAGRVRFEIAAADDIEVFDGDRRAFVVPEIASLPIPGNTVHVLRSAPRLFLAPLSSPARLEERGAVPNAELLAMRFEAGTSEDVRLDGITLHAAEGTTLDGASRFRVEANGEPVDADLALSGDGRSVRFTDLDLDVDAGDELSLTFRAHLEPPAAGAVAAATEPAPAAVIRVVAAPVAVAFLLLCALCSRRLRSDLRAVTVGCFLFVIVAVGCGPAAIGGLAAGLAISGGGGGGSDGSVLAARYQVTLDPSVDITARGRETGAPVILESPAAVIEGTLFEVHHAPRS